MGVPISRTTLLRRVRSSDLPSAPPVTVLGVDDWAWRKGHRYGTILCDLERRRVIDLLPDRSADTLAAWLTAHPSVSVVVRDRAGAYADGAARGAPDALQIADRWHLLRNSSDALQRILERHHRDLREAARSARPPSGPAPSEEPTAPAAPAPERRLSTSERRSLAAQEHRDARFAEAARLREQGMSIRAVARSLGVERKTMGRWLRAGRAPTWRHYDRGTSILDPHRAYLEERWQAGCHNAAALWRELKDRGFAGQYTVVRNWGTQRRRQDPPAKAKRSPRKPLPDKAPEPPTPRKAVRLLTGEVSRLDDDQRRFVTARKHPASAAGVVL